MRVQVKFKKWSLAVISLNNCFITKFATELLNSF